MSGKTGPVHLLSHACPPEGGPRRPSGAFSPEASPHTRFLGAQAAASLLAKLAISGIAGGAVYDALVGACATEHGFVLVTRDQRALETYRALDVRVELVA